MKADQRPKKLLHFSVIVNAVSGDSVAIQTVLEHYTSYITVLSTRKGYDQYGIAFSYVDEELRGRLETKLITKILAFKIA